VSVDLAEVVLWGTTIGAVHWNRKTECGSFEYTPAFAKSGIELSPLMLPLVKSSPSVPIGSSRVFSYPQLARESFQGLPGMLADSLPDRFGNLLIDQWLTRQGRDQKSFSPVERLCYIGSRGMGALEFKPAIRSTDTQSDQLDIAQLVTLANTAVANRGQLAKSLSASDQLNEAALNQIIQVGTSAGGARAKAVIAWNPETGEIRSGQVAAPPRFTYWLIKFDGVDGNRDKELADPQGFAKIEYAYHLMARAAGIEMADCRLLQENGRNHFMTRRFDRDDQGGKLHMQTLCGMAHLDFNIAGGASYEQAMDVMLQIGLSKGEIIEQFRRMVFNAVARNQDDHTKNIAFLMDRSGQWRLSPGYDITLSYDITFSYNPQGAWTQSHQMTINGKRDHFDGNDFRSVGDRFRISKASQREVFSSVRQSIEKWPDFAEEAGVDIEDIRAIQGFFRHDLIC